MLFCRVSKRLSSFMAVSGTGMNDVSTHIRLKLALNSGSASSTKTLRVTRARSTLFKSEDGVCSYSGSAKYLTKRLLPSD